MRRARRLRCPEDSAWSRTRRSRPAPCRPARDARDGRGPAHPDRAREAEQAVEEVEVREDRREVLAVPFARRLGDEATVQPDLAGLRRVQAGEDLREGGLAAAVSAGHEHDLARPEREIEGTELEGRVPFSAGYAKTTPLSSSRSHPTLALGLPARANAGVQPAGQLRHSLDGETAPGDVRPRVDDAPERTHHVDHHEQVAGERLAAALAQARHAEHQDPDEQEEQRLAPGAGDRLTDGAAQAGLAAPPPGSSRWSRRETPRGAARAASAPSRRRSARGDGRRGVLGAATPGRHCRRTGRSRSREADGAERDEAGRRPGRSARKAIRGRRRSRPRMREIDDEAGQALDGPGDDGDVVGERDQHPRHADRLEPRQGYGEQSPAQVPVEVGEHALREVIHEDLGGCRPKSTRAATRPANPHTSAVPA